ncbi:hypothetical protein [Agromyces flavus]
MADEPADPAVVESAPAAEAEAAEPGTPPAEEQAAPPAEEPVAEEPVEEPAEPAEPAAEPAPVEEPAAPVADEPTTEDPAAEEPGATLAEAPAAEAPAESVAAGDVAALIVPPGEDPVDKVTICHRTDSYSNPYVVITPAANAEVGGQPSAIGHGEEHLGPIFYPDIPKHTEWGDIVPAFYYNDGGESDPEFFPGLNWDAEGQAIYENDCALPQPPPPPTMKVEYTTCVGYDGDDPSLTVTLEGLRANLDYRVTVSNQDGVVDVWVIPAGTSGTVSNVWDPIPGGSYTVVFEQSIVEGVWEVVDEESFTVEECLVLDVTVAAIGCSLGYDGDALVSLSGLVVDEEYDWVLIGDDYFAEGTLVAEAESMDVPFGDLAPGNYLLEIGWPAGEEPIVLADATFFVEPCPPDVTVTVTQCPAYGGTGSAVVHLTSLVEGLTYEVWVIDENDVVQGGVQAVVGDATHMADVEFTDLPADMSYDVYVYAPWEPPGGMSEWGEVDYWELNAHTSFTLDPCPPKPHEPGKPATPAGLAETGAGGTGGLLAASMVLLGLGGAALIAQRHRAAGARTKE